MKKQFVTYEIAEQLKELDFDEKCIAFYYIFDDEEKFLISTISNTNSSWDNGYISAPFWQQVIDWLREKHKIRVCNVISYDEIKNIHVHFLILTDDRNCITISNNDYYKSREQAILKAIELCQNKK